MDDRLDVILLPLFLIEWQACLCYLARFYGSGVGMIDLTIGNLLLVPICVNVAVPQKGWMKDLWDQIG